MRILILNYEYPPLGGGAGNATFYLLREFGKIPHLEIDLVTSSVNEFKIEKISENITIHYLNIGKRGNPHYQSIKDLFNYFVKSYFYSRKLLKKNKYDLIHAFFGIPCGFAAMLLGLPYIVSLRGSDVPFYNERFRILDGLIFNKLSRIIWSKARAVIAISYDLVRIARITDRKRKIGVIYNGIDTDEFYPDENILQKEKNFNILFVGRLIKRKGLIYLLEAFENLHKKYSAARLMVAGSGPLMNFYENYCHKVGISEKVSFLGVLGHKELNGIYQKSHVFVLPSINEAMGNVTLEAIATGLPVITTKTGAAEIISGNGIVVEKESSEQIEQALEKLISNENLRREMGRKSREVALEMGWNKTAGQYYDLYKQILNEPR